VKFINLTRQTEIGANSYYLEAAGQSLVLDSGMHPKPQEGDDTLPHFDAMGGRRIDAIIVSHAHQDHIGTLPVLMRREPQARVFMTEATADIGEALLHNSVNVMTRQREELGTTLYPLFTHKEADRASDAWRVCRFPAGDESRRQTGGESPGGRDHV
jgi:predicted metal-dependent RNase